MMILNRVRVELACEEYPTRDTPRGTGAGKRGMWVVDGERQSLYDVCRVNDDELRRT